MGRFREILAKVGTRIAFPKAMPVAYRVREVLGDIAFATLCKRCGGYEIALPIARYWRFEICTRMGLTRADMARRLGCTETLVYKFVREQRKTPAIRSIPAVKFFDRDVRKSAAGQSGRG